MGAGAARRVLFTTLYVGTGPARLGTAQPSADKQFLALITSFVYICHSIISDELVKSLEKKSSWLSKQYKYKSNEKKRPGKEKLYSDIFGMEGSFRQLSVD